MPKFWVTLNGISATCDVEARDAAHAREIAEESGNVDWNYDHGSTTAEDLEVSPKDGD